MKIRKVNDEVLYADEPIVKVEQHDIEWMKELVKSNPRHRIRLCTHPGVEDRIHEMLIILGEQTYIRPHKHPAKSESFHIIEGSVDVVIFDDEGRITETIEMGSYGSGKLFFYRLSQPFYHTVRIRSEWAIFHETTNGPFDRADTVFASWSPGEENAEAGWQYNQQLDHAISALLGTKK